ncbi:MAG: hypothetical protein JWN25_1767 [Verrucomicrobiales bacterium]|nr:hypothetical protein [Verrucomicrobiales bacterium]
MRLSIHKLFFRHSSGRSTRHSGISSGKSQNAQFMKSPTSQGLKWMSVLTGASLIFSCSNQTAHLNAQGTPPLFTSTQQTETTPVTSAPPVASSEEAVPDPTPIPAPPAAPEPAGPLQVPSTYSPAVAELAKLAQGNVSDSILTSYIDNHKFVFNLTADEILYLTDLGISDDVVAAILNHDKTIKGGLVTSTNPASTEPYNPSVTSNMTAGVPVYSAPPPVTGAISAPEVQADVNVSYFHDSLTPYGSWVQVEDYGTCWQPSAVVVNPSWRPYSNRGHWLDTDNGWYWQSDYSWGWATFHYGRWYSSPRHGWVWCPDTTWGPSWVSWRNSHDYCGWAPLPPRACYTPGLGFTYRDRHVGLTFEFGLGREHYTFVPTSRFYDRNPYRYSVRENERRNVYNNTTVINNYVQVNNTVINRGVSRDRVAAAANQPIHTVKLRDMSTATAMASPKREVLDKNANSLAVYRPQASNPSLATSGYSPSQAKKPAVSPKAVPVAPVFANRPVFNPAAAPAASANPSSVVGRAVNRPTSAADANPRSPAVPRGTASTSINPSAERYSGPAKAPNYDGVVRGTDAVSVSRPARSPLNSLQTPTPTPGANSSVFANNNNSVLAQPQVNNSRPSQPSVAANPQVRPTTEARNIFAPQIGSPAGGAISRPLNQPVQTSPRAEESVPRSVPVTRLPANDSVPAVNSRSQAYNPEFQPRATPTRPTSPEYQIPTPHYESLRPQVPAQAAPSVLPRASQAQPAYQAPATSRSESVVPPRAQQAPAVQNSRTDSSRSGGDDSNPQRGRNSR